MIYKFAEYIKENLSKDYYILYHSTDSDFFETLNTNMAKKGDRYFNPLGNGLYCSSNLEFSRTYGRNTYYYLLPKNSKIKKVTYKSWSESTYENILKLILKQYNIDYRNKKQVSFSQFYDLMRLRNDTPIESLNSLEEVLRIYFKLDNIQDTMEKVVDKINSRYDAIWYKETDFYLDADEILIPANSFKKDLFKKVI